MSHATTLIDPAEKVTEGTCPSSSCRAVYPLNEAGQMPDHPRANEFGPHARRCPCSGWLADNPHPRRHFYVEGVQFL
ncbi:MAG TPA: hypothetical protein VF892_17860 [Pseudonocardiaceae bacterium]